MVTREPTAEEVALARHVIAAAYGWDGGKAVEDIANALATHADRAVEREREREPRDMSMRELHDGGLNPWAVELVAEAFVKKIVPADINRVSFAITTYGGGVPNQRVAITLQLLQPRPGAQEVGRG